MIAARLDLLSPDEKRLLQRAAVVGRTFSKDHLAAVDVDTPERLLGGLAARDMVQPLGSELGVQAHADPRRRLRVAGAHRARRGSTSPWRDGWRRAGHGDRQVIATHYAVAAGLGLSEARSDAVRLLLDAAFDARRAGAHGLGLRQAERALALAADDRRALGASYEAVGDAYWMAEQIEKAFEAYDRALEHGVAAGLPPVGHGPPALEVGRRADALEREQGDGGHAVSGSRTRSPAGWTTRPRRATRRWRPGC